MKTARKPSEHADPTNFFAVMREFVRLKYGNPGQWGHGRWPHTRKKGPGRRRLPLDGPNSRVHLATTKLVRSFIRGSRRESTYWRRMYAALTGKQYGV